MQIRKQFRFEAAHVLPYHPGKCARMHGHSYRFDITLAGSLQTSGPAQGMVVDFDDVAAVVTPRVVDRLDHSTLNDLIDNPTAERIALWIWDAIVAELPQLCEVVVWETATACAIARGDDARTR
ncbi:MAG: 6-carboxytetrahydropterin synthase QueD [Vulcanimicrobiaceae bacterium]